MLFLTVFLDLVGFGMIIPILPTYAESMHATDVEAGFLQAIYSIMQLGFSPIWGRISDRIGRRPVLLVSILGSCGSQLGFAFAPSFWWLVVARGFAGVCGANITAAQAYVADVTDAKSRAAGMGMFGAAMGLGFVLGPAIGAGLVQISPQTPFLAAGCLAGVNFVLAWFILKEPRTASERSEARALSWSAVIATIKTPKLLSLIVLFFLVTLGFANLESTFSFFLERRFSYGQREASFVFAYIGVILIGVQGGLVRRLVPRFGERRLVWFGTGMMAVGFVGLWVSDNLLSLLVSLFIIGVGNGVNTPSLSSLISRSAGGDRQGGVLGVNQAAGALARTLGPLLGTFMLRFDATTPYLTGAIILACACAFAVANVAEPPEGS